MESYKGYTIKKVEAYGFCEILDKNSKYLRNALTSAIAKEYIDLIENSRY